MRPPVSVALYGFSDFEATALASVFRLTGPRQFAYVQAASLHAADVIVVNGERAAHGAAVEAAGRSADAIFIGAHAPAHGAARMPRPIDTVRLLRELDALAARGRHATRSSTSATVEEAGAALPVDALIVDDSPIAQAYLRLRLSEIGLGAALAADSAQALRWLAQRSFGHVFVDLDLGESSRLDGLGLCRHIKRMHHHVDDRVPVLVIVSAHHGELDRVRGTFAGCDHYLSKPVHGDTLRKLIRPSRRSRRSQAAPD